MPEATTTTKLTARDRFVHTMRKWAADEARAIERIPAPSEKVTAADAYAATRSGQSASQHTADYVKRQQQAEAARAERRWAFVEEQCAGYEVVL